MDRFGQTRSATADYSRAGITIVGVGAIGAVAYGATTGGVAGALASALIASGPLALGALLGFLFGIPRVQLAASSDADSAAAMVYQPNTSLEQVSDWLTKLLIGVGLTQLAQLPEGLSAIAKLGAQSIGSDATPGVVAAMCVFFAIGGFLIGYNVTRLVLGPAIRAIEQPDPQVVARVATAPISPKQTLTTAVDATDASELMRFSIDDLRTPDQFIAWGRAKLERNPDSDDAVTALERAADAIPGNRSAIENLVFAALYIPAPKGYRIAIRYAERFIDASPQRDAPENANLYAFLACAYGQAHRYQTKATPDAATALDSLRNQAVAAAEKAISLDQSWKSVLRNLADPKPGDDENDLDSLRDDAELTRVLGITPASH
jgi:hypothetical protein